MSMFVNTASLPAEKSVVAPPVQPKEPIVSAARGYETVKAILETPVPVTTANIESTVIKDGFLTPAEICTGVYAQYCTKYGIH